MYNMYIYCICKKKKKNTYTCALVFTGFTVSSSCVEENALLASKLTMISLVEDHRKTTVTEITTGYNQGIISEP